MAVTNVSVAAHTMAEPALLPAGLGLLQLVSSETQLLRANVSVDLLSGFLATIVVARLEPLSAALFAGVYFDSPDRSAEIRHSDSLLKVVHWRLLLILNVFFKKTHSNQCFTGCELASRSWDYFFC